MLLGSDVYESSKSAVSLCSVNRMTTNEQYQERAGPSDQNATATRQIDTDTTMDAQAIFERDQAIMEEKRLNPQDKTYRGMNVTNNMFQPVKDSVIGNAKSGFVR